MQESSVESIYVTERVNGWWISVRYESGYEEHRGPYLDEDSANAEAEQLSAEKLPSPDA